MTAAKPPARQRAVGALASGFATAELHHQPGHDLGGLKLDQVRRLKELEAENTRLRKAVAELTLEKLILKEAAAGNW